MGIADTARPNRELLDVAHLSRRDSLRHHLTGGNSGRRDAPPAHLSTG